MFNVAYYERWYDSDPLTPGEEFDIFIAYIEIIPDPCPCQYSIDSLISVVLSQAIQERKNDLNFYKRISGDTVSTSVPDSFPIMVNTFTKALCILGDSTICDGADRCCQYQKEIRMRMPYEYYDDYNDPGDYVGINMICDTLLPCELECQATSINTAGVSMEETPCDTVCDGPITRDTILQPYTYDYLNSCMPPCQYVVEIENTQTICDPDTIRETKILRFVDMDSSCFDCLGGEPYSEEHLSLLLGDARRKILDSHTLPDTVKAAAQVGDTIRNLKVLSSTCWLDWNNNVGPTPQDTVTRDSLIDIYGIYIPCLPRNFCCVSEYYAVKINDTDFEYTDVDVSDLINNCDTTGCFAICGDYLYKVGEEVQPTIPDLKLYPNPARTIVNIVGLGYLDKVSAVSLYDEFGRKVRFVIYNKQIDNIKFSVSGLPVGNYYLVADQNGMNFYLGQIRKE